MKSKLLSVVLIVAFLLISLSTLLPVNTRPMAANAAQVSDKDPSNLPDPNRPSYDMWGNKFSYDGVLLETGACPYSDPITGQANPYCPAAPTVAPEAAPQLCEGK
jgi:hypothetical protein